MKRMILLMALAGFTAAGSYAQNKDCQGSHVAKTVHKTPVITPRVPTKNQDPSCFMVKKENIGIPGCTDVTYSSDRVYLGYYLKKEASARKTPSACKTIKTYKATRVTTAPMQAMPEHYYKQVSDQLPLPCYTYTSKSNVVVKECPDDFYNESTEPLKAAPIMYSRDHDFSGYYPGYDQEIKDPNKPENKVYDDNTPTTPDQNLCFWDCK